jgi:hypothetical protein
LDDPGRVRSQITSVVCQIQRFDFDCNLVLTRKLIIRIPAGLGLNPLYVVGSIYVVPPPARGWTIETTTDVPGPPPPVSLSPPGVLAPAAPTGGRPRRRRRPVSPGISRNVEARALVPDGPLRSGGRLGAGRQTRRRAAGGRWYLGYQHPERRRGRSPYEGTVNNGPPSEDRELSYQLLAHGKIHRVDPKFTS